MNVKYIRFYFCYYGLTIIFLVHSVGQMAVLAVDENMRNN